MSFLSEMGVVSVVRGTLGSLHHIFSGGRRFRSTVLSLLGTCTRRFAWLLALGLMASKAAASTTHLPEVAFAGFAYSGSISTVEARFRHSRRYEDALRHTGVPVARKMQGLLDANPPTGLRLVPQVEALAGRDQALAVALVVGAETVSVEQFGDVHKLMALVRAQAMFFDFKSMNVVRSYPISFAYVDLLGHVPSDDEIHERVKLVYEGAGGKPGLLARFAQTVAAAQLPAHVPRYLQVTAAELKPEALDGLPSFLKAEPDTAQTWAADLVSEAISTRAGVPIVPFAKGYAIGNVMSMRVSDGTVYELKLPQPDYEIKVELTGFRKVKFSEVAGGATSFIYAAYAQLQITEPLSGKVYLGTALKNGETRVIPASQREGDEFPHRYDAVNGLFVKLAQSMDGKGDAKWLKSAAAAPDIEEQMARTKELIQKCK